MKIVKGNTIEKQIEHIDVILDRFSRKLHKTTSGIISPYPISNYSMSAGIVLRYVFPIDGEIPLAAMYIESMPKSGVNVHTIIEIGESRKSDTQLVKRKSVVIRPNIQLKGGTRISVGVTPVNDEEEACGIWVSLIWVPSIRGAVVKQFLIDELERIGREAVECEEG